MAASSALVVTSSAPAAASSAPVAASSAPAADLSSAVSTAAVGRVSHNPSQKGNSQNSHKRGRAFDGSNSVRPKKGSFDCNQIQRIPTTGLWGFFREFRVVYETENLRVITFWNPNDISVNETKNENCWESEFLFKRFKRMM